MEASRIGLATIPATRPTMRVATAVIRARLNEGPPLMVDSVGVTVTFCVEVTVVVVEDKIGVLVLVAAIDETGD